MSGMESSNELRRQAYSLLKAAEAIEEASSTCSTSRSYHSSSMKSSENESTSTAVINRIQNIRIEQEHGNLMGLMRSSQSDLATVTSRDSSEIPFDERSTSAVSFSYSSNSNNSNKHFPTNEPAEGRDDTEVKSNRSSGSENRECHSSAHSLTTPYTEMKMIPPAGTYLYLHFNHDQSQKKRAIFSSCDSSSSGSTLISVEEKQPDKQMASTQFHDTLSETLSSDCDDSIGKIRNDAESTIDENSKTDLRDADDQSLATERTRNTITPNHSTEDPTGSSSSTSSGASATGSDEQPPRSNAMSRTKSMSSSRLLKEAEFEYTKQSTRSSSPTTEGTRGSSQARGWWEAEEIKLTDDVPGFEQASNDSATDDTSRIALSFTRSVKSNEKDSTVSDQPTKRSPPRSASSSESSRRTLNSEQQNDPALTSLQKSSSEESQPHDEMTSRLQVHTYSREPSPPKLIIGQPGVHKNTDNEPDDELEMRFTQKTHSRRGRASEDSRPRSQQAKDKWKERLRFERYISRSLSPLKPVVGLESTITLEKCNNDRPPRHVKALSISESEELSTMSCTGESETGSAQPKSQGTGSSASETKSGTRPPNENDRMLQECYTAIISLRETSESKYNALQSKYLELKGSLSHNGAKDPTVQNTSKEEEYEAKITTLENKQRELDKVVAQLERKNFELLEENSQLSLEAQLTKKLETRCQGVEERCTELQIGFSDLETRNLELRDENLGLLSKCQELEEKCQDLETLNGELETQKQLEEDNKGGYQQKSKALEEISQQLEESNCLLEAQVSELNTEKETIQSKLKSALAQNLMLEESNKELVAQSQLIRDEKVNFKSELQTVEARCRDLQQSQEGNQFDLEDVQSKILVLEKSNSEMQTSNQKLCAEKEACQSKIHELELKISDIKESNGQLVNRNLQLEDLNQQLQAKLPELESSFALMESVNVDLVAENATLQDKNESLKAMQTSLEESLKETKKEVKDLLCATKETFHHLFPQIDVSQQANAPPANDTLSCSSSDSSEDDCNPNDAEGQSTSGYEVISSQEIQSFNLNFTRFQKGAMDANGHRKDHITDAIKTLEDELQAKLKQLAGSGSSDDEEEHVESDQPTEHGNRDTTVEKRKEVEQSSVEDEELIPRQKQFLPSWAGPSPRQLPPLSPRPAPNTRPPLPPAFRASSKQSDQADVRSEAAIEVDSSESYASDGSEKSRENEKRSESPHSQRRGQREQSPASILHELLREHNAGEGTLPLLQRSHDHQSSEPDCNRPLSPGECSRSSRKTRYQDEHKRNKSAPPRSKRVDFDEPTSPNQQSRRSHKSTEGRIHEDALGKSSSSSPVMAHLFGSSSDPKVIPEGSLSEEQPMVQNGVMIVYGTESGGEGPLLPYLTPNHHKTTDGEAAYGSPTSELTTEEEESNSIVSHSSTHTFDLLNTPSRKAKQISRKIEKGMGRMEQAKATKRKSRCGDCFMSSQHDEPPPKNTEGYHTKDLPKTARSNLRFGCSETGGCGVDLQDSCTSIRTWNFGKKQSSGHLIANHEHSSIASDKTAPTGRATAFTGDTAQQAATVTSFESGSSENATGASSSKGRSSLILAKRDKLILLRRKQGHGVAVQTATSSGSTQSERGASNLEKKSPTKSVGVFPFYSS